MNQIKIGGWKDWCKWYCSTDYLQIIGKHVETVTLKYEEWEM